jgi:hypothetical protein
MSPGDLREIRQAVEDSYDGADHQTIMQDIRLLIAHIDKMQGVVDAVRQTLSAAVRLQVASQALSLPE